LFLHFENISPEKKCFSTQKTLKKKKPEIFFLLWLSLLE
jgi:hypothetical protein